MKDVFFDLNQSPSEWLRVELGKIFEIFGGFAAPQDDEAFVDGAVPFVRMQDLGRYHRTTNLVVTKDRLSADYVKQHKLRIVPKGSILIPRSGSVSLNHRAILGVDACVVSHICALVPKIPEVDVRFLYYSLCNFDMRKIMKKTTGLDAITFQDIKRVLIPLPSFRTQKAIADVLQKVDNLKQKREEANLMANKILQTVFLQMFGDPATNPKRYQETTVEAVCSEITDCPHSTPVYADSGIPLVRTPNIRKGYIDFNKTKFVSNEEHLKRVRRIHPTNGDILYAREATFGNAALVNSDREFSVGQRIMLLRPNPILVKSEFLVWIVNSDFVYRQAERAARGSTNPHVNVGDVKNFKIILPPLNLQIRFASFMKEVDSLRERQERSTLETIKLLGSLMSKAFRGELLH